MALLKSFDANHAKRLLNIAQRFGDRLDLYEVMKKHSHAISQGDAKGSMDEYMEQLEGVYECEVSPDIKKGTKDAPKVDTENQFVTHDPGLEKEGKPLIGEAKKTRNAPDNAVGYKPAGRYIIDKIDKSSYAIGSELELKFYGTYHGKKADFSGIKVKIVAAPIKRKGHKYVKVRFPHNQEVLIRQINKKVYFTTDLGSFYVRIN